MQPSDSYWANPWTSRYIEDVWYQAGIFPIVVPYKVLDGYFEIAVDFGECVEDLIVLPRKQKSN